jgi:flagellar hook-associated protein 1 FlgK
MSLLSIGKSGVLAYQNALAGISENVVNANNPGYAKREVTMKEQVSAGGPLFLAHNATSFNGVLGADVSRVWDQYRAQRAWNANSDSSQASTRSQWYSTVEGALNDGDSGVGVKLTAIFTSANALAANPDDATLRQSFLYAIQDAAGAINKTAATLAKVSGSVASQAGDAVAQVNGGLTALARINLALKTTPQGTAGRAALEDQRDTIIGTISDKIGVDLSFDSYGAATIRMNDTGGPVLLDGNNVMPGQLDLQVATNGTLSMTVTIDSNTSAVSPASGSLAGYAEAANQILGRRQQLDTLAGDLVQKINAWNAQGKDINGTTGGNLMSGTDAASIALAVTDTDLVAAADATTPNGNLVALKDLRDANGAEAAWRGIVTDQGLRVQTAQTLEAGASSAKDAAYSDLDDVSGVDLDNEAADLMRFQQAYSASAKIIQAARETLQSILELF